MNSYGGNTIFRALMGISLLAAQVGLAQKFHVLHIFNDVDGAYPLSTMVLDRDANLYGTTFAGGGIGGPCGDGCGTVFKLAQLGSAWVLTPLHLFMGFNDGGGPQQGVVFGPDGALYGTTAGSGSVPPYFGGSPGHGTVYRLVPPEVPCGNASCFWRKDTLYRFRGAPDGGEPGYGYGGQLVFDQAGNIFGTTPYGGITGPPCNDGFGCGVVYELSPSGNQWNESIIHAFSGGATDGRQPNTGITLDLRGNLYGTTEYGGLYRSGNAYEVVHAGSGWVQNTIYNFADYPGGGTLAIDHFGNLFSTAGEDSYVYELSQAGSGWTLNVLYSFGGGGYLLANGSLVMDPSGNLYGTTYDGGLGGGNVFKLTPIVGGWTYTDLHDFQGADGLFPAAGVTLDASGNIYGTTLEGGNMSDCHQAGCGVIWEITPN